MEMNDDSNVVEKGITPPPAPSGSATTGPSLGYTATSYMSLGLDDTSFRSPSPLVLTPATPGSERVGVDDNDDIIHSPSPGGVRPAAGFASEVSVTATAATAATATVTVSGASPRRHSQNGAETPMIDDTAPRTPDEMVPKTPNGGNDNHGEALDGVQEEASEIPTTTEKKSKWIGLSAAEVAMKLFKREKKRAAKARKAQQTSDWGLHKDKVKEKEELLAKRMAMVRGGRGGAVLGGGLLSPHPGSVVKTGGGVRSPPVSGDRKVDQQPFGTTPSPVKARRRLLSARAGGPNNVVQSPVKDKAAKLSPAKLLSTTKPNAKSETSAARSQHSPQGTEDVVEEEEEEGEKKNKSGNQVGMVEGSSPSLVDGNEGGDEEAEEHRSEQMLESVAEEGLDAVAAAAGEEHEQEHEQEHAPKAMIPSMPTLATDGHRYGDFAAEEEGEEKEDQELEIYDDSDSFDSSYSSYDSDVDSDDGEEALRGAIPKPSPWDDDSAIDRGLAFVGVEDGDARGGDNLLAWGLGEKEGVCSWHDEDGNGGGDAEDAFNAALRQQLLHTEKNMVSRIGDIWQRGGPLIGGGAQRAMDGVRRGAFDTRASMIADDD